MATNSLPRRVLKRLLFPLFQERYYKYFQALAMAWDIRRGTLTEPELDLVPLAVRAGEMALDLGANFGLYTYHLSRAVGRSGRVYAFEPVPFTYNTLRVVARILRLGNVEVVPKGCSDRGGRVAFRVPVQASGAVCAGQSHLGTRNDDHAGKETQVRWNKTKEIWCDIVALDEALPDLAELSFIKSDIEGAELLAFRGAEKTIDRHRPTVLCEINPWFLDGFGIQLEELTGFFFHKGYRLYHYDDGQHCLNEVAGKVVEDNYLFLHPCRADRFASLLPSSNQRPG
jgi:FkbM family methyltransferase